MEKRLTKEEFLKDLWHTASEKPNIKQGECCVTCLVKFKNGSTELCVYFRNPEGWVCDDMTPKDFKRHFKGWLYIDDNDLGSEPIVVKSTVYEQLYIVNS
uniref:hypothetical protein n=1 Tax=Alloprevotella sp. TaxID=1872471 RepID=UPI003FEDE1A0